MDAEEVWRLHREALKEAATDPTSGRIDISILTTDIPAAGRERRREVAAAFRQIVKDHRPWTTPNSTRRSANSPTL